MNDMPDPINAPVAFNIWRQCNPQFDMMQQGFVNNTPLTPQLIARNKKIAKIVFPIIILCFLLLFTIPIIVSFFAYNFTSTAFSINTYEVKTLINRKLKYGDNIKLLSKTYGETFHFIWHPETNCVDFAAAFNALVPNSKIVFSKNHAFNLVDGEIIEPQIGLEKGDYYSKPWTIFDLPNKEKKRIRKYFE